MSDWKYIMFHVDGQDIPIIFPGNLIHADVRDVMEIIIGKTFQSGPMRVVSAGHIPALQVVSTEGSSETLGGLRSRPEDASVINTYPYAHGRPSPLDIDRVLSLRFTELLFEKLGI